MKTENLREIHWVRVDGMKKRGVEKREREREKEGERERVEKRMRVQRSKWKTTMTTETPCDAYRDTIASLA